MNEDERSKLGVWHSLSTKVALIVFLCVVVSCTFTAVMSISKMRKVTGEMVENYAQTVAQDSARNIDGAETGGVEFNNEVAQTMIATAGLIGIDSSYVYVCDENGTMLYHPTASKIGSTVENAAVKSIVARLKRGEKVEPGSLIYEYNGEKKLAGYALTESNKIIVATADYDDAMENVTATIQEVTLLNVGSVIFMTIIGFILCRFFVGAVAKIVNIVEKTAQFDFRSTESTEKMLARKDEIGIIARALADMRANLRGIVNQISSSTITLNDNLEELKGESIDVHALCTDNSATTQELAAGMEETSATTEMINGNIEAMLENAKGIDSLAIERA